MTGEYQLRPTDPEKGFALVRSAPQSIRQLRAVPSHRMARFTSALLPIRRS